MKGELIFCGGWAVRDRLRGWEEEDMEEEEGGGDGVTDLSRCDSSESFHGEKKASVAL